MHIMGNERDAYGRRGKAEAGSSKKKEQSAHESEMHSQSLTEREVMIEFGGENGPRKRHSLSEPTFRSPLDNIEKRKSNARDGISRMKKSNESRERFSPHINHQPLLSIKVQQPRIALNNRLLTHTRSAIVVIVSLLTAWNVYIGLRGSKAIVGDLYAGQMPDSFAALSNNTHAAHVEISTDASVEQQSIEEVLLPPRHSSGNVYDELIYSSRSNSTVVHNSGNPSTPTKIVWRTWKDSKLPPSVEERWHRTALQNPEYAFPLVSDDQMEALISNNFAPIVLDAFRSINPALGAARADFWRYCVLYVYGGIYIDVDSGVNYPLRELLAANQISRENDTTTALLALTGNAWETAQGCKPAWSKANLTFPEFTVPVSYPGAEPNQTYGVVQWMMVFLRPRHPILLEAIRLAAELVTLWRDDDEELNQWTAHQKVVCTTGPMVFATAVHNVLMSENVGGDLARLSVKFSAMRDYGPYVAYKMEGDEQAMHETKPRYASLGNVPLKVAPKIVVPRNK